MIATILKALGQLLTWFIIVNPWEQAIRIRCGNKKRLMSAGIYVRIPFIDGVFKQSIRRRIQVITPQTLTSSDGKVITCGGAIGYEIKDLFKLYDTLECPNDTISNEVGGLVSKFIASKKLGEISISQIEEFVQKNLNLSEYGLSGQEFFITQLAATKTYRFITGEIPAWSHNRNALDMMPVDYPKP